LIHLLFWISDATLRRRTERPALRKKVGGAETKLCPRPVQAILPGVDRRPEAVPPVEPTTSVEPDVSSLIGVDEAIRRLDAEPLTTRTVRKPLASAHGCVLAEDVLADADQPPFDRALMDGYAVRSADTSPGARLRVVGEANAGAGWDGTVAASHAAQIATGAPVPAGADAVVAVEFTRRDGDLVVLEAAVPAGRAIARRGSDCRAGDVVLRAGQSLTPAALAAAATVGAAKPLLFARPNVAVINTGDELVAAGDAIGGATIRDSSGVALPALLSALGHPPTRALRVHDDPASLKHAFELALDLNDVLITTGGVSMGERDYVPRVLAELGFVARITKLKIRPGKPFVFAVRERDGKVAFGLPGNPVSSFVCTLVLVRRVLDRLAGRRAAGNTTRAAALAVDLPANGPRQFYQPATLGPGGMITPMKWNGSADVFTLSRADALVVRPEHDPARRAGESVNYIEVPS
jgi:molybdopterin molybdotransferase